MNIFGCCYHWSKGNWSFVVNVPNKKILFEWCKVRCKKFSKVKGPHAQCMLLILGSIVAGGGMDDHLMSTRIFTLKVKKHGLMSSKY